MRLTAVVSLLAVLALPVALAAQAPSVATVPGGSLLEWLGLATGDRLTYATADGERVCVEVGEPLRVGNNRYVPLNGLPWPGLASDSKIFLPLGGTLGIGIIRTPTLRAAQAFDWLVAPGVTRFIERLDLAHPGALPGDGWYAIGGAPEAPSAYLYVWCSVCSDAGTYVWLERGKGITRVEEQSIAGPRRLTLIGEGCPSQETEFQLYVAPAPERSP